MKRTTQEHQEAKLGAEAGHVDTDPGESLLESTAVGFITPSKAVPRNAAGPGDHGERVPRR
jgi:hypothetical protein